MSLHMTSYRLWIKYIFVPSHYQTSYSRSEWQAHLKQEYYFLEKTKPSKTKNLERKQCKEYFRSVESDRKTKHMKSFNPLISLLIAVKYLSLWDLSKRNNQSLMNESFLIFQEKVVYLCSSCWWITKVTFYCLFQLFISRKISTSVISNLSEKRMKLVFVTTASETPQNEQRGQKIVNKRKRLCLQ